MQPTDAKLTKPERALRAYLNTSEVPKGFRGNSYTCKDGTVIELDINPKNLSRYATYVACIEEWAITLPKSIEGVSPEVYGKVISATKASETEKALEFCNSIKEKEIIANLRQKGSIIYFSEAALTIVDNLEKNESAHINDLELIKAKFQTNIKNEIEKQQKLTADNHVNGHGRANFPLEFKTALEFLRTRLFDELTMQDVMKSLEITKEDKVTDKERATLELQLELHKQFSFRKTMEVNGRKFMVEASPFTEKGIMEPISDLDIVVYPQDEQIIEAMKTIANPEFEHADGSVVAASILIKNKVQLVEEMQTEVPDLLRKASLTRDVTKETEILLPIIEDWELLAMEAIQVFAKEHKFSEFYIMTPWGVTRRYQSSIHPDKLTKIYFSVLQRLGGELVFDDKTKVWTVPAYYWKFDADSDLIVKAEKNKSKWSFRT
ncbi:MAG: hypothetical protein Q7S22_08445 [Candidatus Micrarchaeota archaeon]|nr:hypothetical protein [Candidatus Micrarchaeota archaeon]